VEAKRTCRERRRRINPTRLTDTVEKFSAKKLWNWNLKRWNPGK
jgi:hypothetical protein